MITSDETPVITIATNNNNYNNIHKHTTDFFYDFIFLTCASRTSFSEIRSCTLASLSRKMFCVVDS